MLYNNLFELRQNFQTHGALILDHLMMKSRIALDKRSVRHRVPHTIVVAKQKSIRVTTTGSDYLSQISRFV